MYACMMFIQKLHKIMFRLDALILKARWTYVEGLCIRLSKGQSTYNIMYGKLYII